MDLNQRRAIGQEKYETGYNCAQAVIGAYVDLLDIDFETATKLSYGFGGGVGHSGEICGALSGAAFVLSMRHGLTKPNPVVKKEVEERILSLFEEFNQQRGALRCFELKGVIQSEKKVHLGTCGQYIEEVITLLGKYM